MNIFRGKSPKERNQIIALIVFGTLALLAVGYNFSGLFFGKSNTSKTAKASPTPAPPNRSSSQNPNMPTQLEMDFEYQTTRVSYDPDAYDAPDPGRNIFAFYEPPKPTPYSPTPVPEPPTPVPPTPTPTPPIFVSYAATNPPVIYAGSRGFRLDVNGDRFTPDTLILFNGNQVPTNYLGPQGLSTEIPASLISFAGVRNISVFTPAGKWSNVITVNVVEPPKPTFEYIGMIGRKRYNNDTAYFEDQGKKEPFGARLNDIVAGRFRLKSISSQEVVFEDKDLGFSHKLKLKRPTPGQATSNGSARPDGSNYVPYFPPNPNEIPAGEIPGIPSNIPRFQPSPIPQKQDQDVDDDGTDEDGNE